MTSLDEQTGYEPKSLPRITRDTCPEDLDKMIDNAQRAANFLKAISHEGRLMILCHLEGLVTPRRDGKAIYYSLADDRPTRIIDVVYDLFCKDEG